MTTTSAASVSNPGTDERTDVLVIGAGMAGLCAAIAARHAGASVIVLEKAPKAERGGNTRFSNGAIRAVYHSVEDIDSLVGGLSASERERAEFGSYSREQYYGDLAKVTHYRSHPDMADMLVENSRETLFWLQKLGLRFLPLYEWQFKLPDGRIRFSGGSALEVYGAGEGASEALFCAAERNGAHIYYQTKALSLIDEGRIAGAIARKDGADIAIRAQSVVLACGGFEANIEWRTRYLGPSWDLMARILADRLSQQMPQRVLIENMGGGGGAIAARTVAKTDPDGYTFLFAGPGHAAVPYMHKQAPYDPIRDFIPVSLVTQFPLVVVINPNVPAKNMHEFIALLKAEPDKHNFGSSGIGGSSHIPVEMLMHMAGVKMTHVPFRGNGPSSAALLGGQIDLIIDGLAPQLGNIAEKRVRVLGVTTKERTPFLPDAPAVSETLPGYQFPMWVGVFAPAKTPKEIVDKMAAEIAKATRDPTTNKRYTDIKVDAVGSTPEQFDAFFREQLKFNENIIKSANIQQD